MVCDDNEPPTLQGFSEWICTHPSNIPDCLMTEMSKVLTLRQVMVKHHLEAVNHRKFLRKYTWMGMMFAWHCKIGLARVFSVTIYLSMLVLRLVR